MLKTVVALLLFSAPAMAAECSFISGDHELFFVTPQLVAVADNSYREPPYACSVLSGGTGVNFKGLVCSDGFDGPLRWNDDEATTITFRDAVWTSTCPDNSPLDIGYDRAN